MMHTISSDLVESAKSLVTGHLISDLANISSLIYHSVPDLNWSGFYLNTGSTLMVGPFQGKPACVEIPFGKGVVGTCFLQKRSINVPDVQAFPEHIACDENSKSELVFPIIVADNVVAVLDLDSPLLRRFDLHTESLIHQLTSEVLISLSWCRI